MPNASAEKTPRLSAVKSLRSFDECHMNPELPDTPEYAARSAVQRIGLVAGPMLFAGILLAPTLPSLAEQAANTLQSAPQDPAVIEVSGSAQRTLALTLLMVVWWVTEAVPLPVTALLPGLMLPLLHITGVDGQALYPFTSGASFAGYASPVIYLFLAGFLLAGAMRKSALDRRLTLAFLTIRPMTRTPGAILLSVMVVTAFLSMWISNTATTAMMLPIAVGILRELREAPGRSGFGCALLLGVAWSASIGGIGTLIGSPPNGIVVGILKAQRIAEIDFVQWMRLGLPVAAVGLVVAWATLMVLFRPQLQNIALAKSALQQQRRAAGPWTAPQYLTLAVFLLVVVLWMTQPFWKVVLPATVYQPISRVGIYEIGLLCAVLLFVIPVERRGWQAVLNWRDHHYVDWGTLLLFGGGIALSDAMFKTGLTQWLASGFVSRVGHFSPWLCLGLTVLLVDFLTEITSNTAVTTMMTPILIVLAPLLELAPLLLCVSAAMASSLAFMLPVATPPNALVYGTGYFRITQMMRAGFFMNLLGCAVVVCCMAAAPPAWYGAAMR